jgi:hypothetical protein
VFLAVFRNLDDPDDNSFEPEAFPMMELEFPNTQASERSVLCVVAHRIALIIFLDISCLRHATPTTIIQSIVLKLLCMLL